MYRTGFLLYLAFVMHCTAYLRFLCPTRLSRQRLDPIVWPDQASSHVHTIVGGAGFGPSMTYAQARSAKCSSCEVREDLSSYWAPELYVKRNVNGSVGYQPVPVMNDPTAYGDVGAMTIYYFFRGEPNGTLHAFPPGFRMLAGSNYRRSFSGSKADSAISFRCLHPDTSLEHTGHEIPNEYCPAGLRAQIYFPQCWDGKHLDSPDHRSHMSYPLGEEYDGGPCPESHPVHMPSIFLEVLYNTTHFLDDWTDGKHPFVFANGDPTGYGYHGDFVNGWDIPVLQSVIDTCHSDGDVDDCAPVSTFSRDEMLDCKIPSVVDEPVVGLLDRLPGCNPIQYGPEEAKMHRCEGQPELESSPPNFVDLTPRGWMYMGCGRDDINNRSFQKYRTGSEAEDAKNNMTVESCVDWCDEGGFAYAGLEFGSECYCDNEVVERARPKEGVMGFCAMRCRGDEEQTCGGYGRLSIYKRCGDGEHCTNNHFRIMGNVKEGGERPVERPAETEKDGPTNEPVPTPAEKEMGGHEKPIMEHETQVKTVEVKWYTLSEEPTDEPTDEPTPTQAEEMGGHETLMAEHDETQVKTVEVKWYTLSEELTDEPTPTQAEELRGHETPMAEHEPQVKTVVVKWYTLSEESPPQETDESLQEQE